MLNYPNINVIWVIKVKEHKKTVLITGAAGFIGYSLVERMLQNNYCVIGIGTTKVLCENNIDDRMNNVQQMQKHPAFRFIDMNICDFDLVMDAFKETRPSTVIHLACLPNMELSLKKPELYYSNNVTVTENILEACRISKTQQLIYISTVTVYGDTKTPSNEESDLPPACNPYVTTKLYNEKLAEFYSHNYGLNVTVLRLCSVYGPRQRPDMAIPRFTRLIDNEEMVQVYGDGMSKKCFLHIDNCAQAIIKAVETPFQYEVFNIGEDEAITLNRLIYLISLYIGKSPKISYIQPKEGIPNNSLVDIQKAKRILNYKPEINIEKGLYQYVEWYKKNKKLI